MTLNTEVCNNQRKKPERKAKKTQADLIRLFWEAPANAFFGQDTIAPVVNCGVKTLECDRWRGRGIPYRKCGGRVLYCKADVIAWLESHQLVTSTSEYVNGGVNHEV